MAITKTKCGYSRPRLTHPHPNKFWPHWRFKKKKLENREFTERKKGWKSCSQNGAFERKSSLDFSNDTPASVWGVLS